MKNCLLLALALCLPLVCCAPVEAGRLVTKTKIVTTDVPTAFADEGGAIVVAPVAVTKTRVRTNARGVRGACNCPGCNCSASAAVEVQIPLMTSQVYSRVWVASPVQIQHRRSFLLAPRACPTCGR